MSTLEERLEQAEGNIPHAYQDGLGYWTIGIGRLIDKRKGGGLSQEEIRYLLANDIKEKTVECQRLFPDFDTFTRLRQETLIELMFNIGYTNLSSYKVFVGQVNSQQWRDVQSNMGGWGKWIKQVGAARVNRLISQLGEP